MQKLAETLGFMLGCWQLWDNQGQPGHRWNLVAGGRIVTVASVLIRYFQLRLSPLPARPYPGWPPCYIPISGALHPSLRDCGASGFPGKVPVPMAVSLGGAEGSVMGTERG